MKLLSIAFAGAQGFGLWGQTGSIWGAWNEWSCQTSGGVKNSVRVRQAPCLAGIPWCWGPLIERDSSSQSCSPQIWGAWGSWSSCSGTPAVRVREAQCLAGAPTCYGPLKEEDKCAPTTIWGSWGPFGPCDTQGKRTRQAKCLAGAPICFGPLEEDLEDPTCTTNPPQTIWGAWTAYGPCDPSTRKRTRTRPCIAGAPQCYGVLSEEETCAARPGFLW